MRNAALLAVAVAFSAPAAAQSVEVRPYGTMSSGEQVQEIVLKNRRGTTVRFISLGAIITAIEVPDRRGRRENVALGFANLADYQAKNKNYYFGGVVGRYAGRIGGARFTLDGREHRLEANDGPNTLHGGSGPGWIGRNWSVEPLQDHRVAGATLHLTSPAGEQNFPGTMRASVTYRLLNDDSLRIDYAATTNAPTHINLTNHSYFNLAGAGSGTVLDHRMQIPSDRVVETDERGIPTGRFLPVAGTPFDFRPPAALRQCVRVPRAEGTPPGCNHSWFYPADDQLRLVGRLTEPRSCRVMEVLTTEPSLHMYTANYMSGEDRGAQGVPYRALESVALETQHLPDTPNKPEFPSTALRPGEVFRSTTIYRFRVR
ncbi:MAG: galactose mutarotase [Pseudomonadota bacterium]|nr:galactose mutarotase [Pseudomonadota bacterium]